MKKTAKNKISIVFLIISVVLFAICLLALLSANWYRETYGDLGFDAVLFTMLSSLNGTASDLILRYIEGAVVPFVIVLAALITLLLFKWRRRLVITVFGKKITLVPFNKACLSLLLTVASIISLYSAANAVSLIDYIKNSYTSSTFFDSYYVDPDGVNIRFPDEKRNLIFINMESMETTFFSREQGGGIQSTVIPELYTMAENNINFSGGSGVGGYSQVTGGQWTIAAIVAQTAGIPLKPPKGINGNDYGENGKFLPGVTSINDILHANGYYQAFMCGSDASFAGRDNYYRSHGVDKVYDYYTAIDDGIIEEGHQEKWGMSDRYLYEYAKQELVKLSDGDKPFAFTMLTIDTHHVDGQLCPLCEDVYDSQYENVFACASRQLNEFITWLQAQSFYANTTVIVTGDHCSMDEMYIASHMQDGYNRQIYNCILNSPIEPAETKNRIATQLDIFPTTLAVLGCQIEGERLGLGVNLFSDKKTLAEELGYTYLNDELAKYSQMYYEKFIMDW